MESSQLRSARQFLVESREVLDACLATDEFISATVTIANAISQSMREGGKLLLAGNGGSAGDAQHIAGEFLSRLNYDREPLPALALTTDTSVLTAVGNDYGYEATFERQVRGLGRAGDVFIGITTSGRSRNVLAALKAARAKRLVTIGFAGENPGEMSALCDHILRVPSPRTPYIQQLHIIAAHIICGMVEETLFPRQGDRAG